MIRSVIMTLEASLWRTVSTSLVALTLTRRSAPPFSSTLCPTARIFRAQRQIQNQYLPDALWLVEEGRRLAEPFNATPLYIFETRGPSWRPYRQLLHQLKLPTATVTGRQARKAQGTGTRKTHNDLKTAYLIAKVFKQSESHATRIPPEPIASLREYTRLHLFFAEQPVAIQNRMFDLRYQIHPTFDDLFSQPIMPTTLALAQEELVHPVRILKTEPETLVQVIRRASRGKLGDRLAEALHHSALASFYTPYAPEAQSFNLKLMGLPMSTPTTRSCLHSGPISRIAYKTCLSNNS
jgi:hypothetical protein